MAHNIEFRPEMPQYDIPKPQPATKFIPEWYKKTPVVSEQMLTAKRCVPLLDSLSAGYIIPLPVDVYWDDDRDPSEGKKYWYDAPFEQVSMHSPTQTEMFEINENFGTQPYKWINHFHIKTPRGYSMLFTHPINRTELPFYSFTGFVDTDKHPIVTNFPFVIRKGFKGVIPAGTPLIQAIPVKRDAWRGVMKDEDQAFRYARQFEVFNPPFAWYKRNWWTKKQYQ